jgi:hypothetical protein
MATSEEPDRTRKRPRRRWSRRDPDGTERVPDQPPAPEGGTTTGPATAAGATTHGGAETSAGTVEPVPPSEPATERAGPRLRYVHPEPTLASLRVLGLSPSLPMPPPGLGTEMEAAGLEPAVPVYGPVDRAVPSDVFTHDIAVTDPDTQKVDFVVRRAYGYPAGSLPAEPGRVPANVDARTAVCNSLTPGAAYRCRRGGGYF